MFEHAFLEERLRNSKSTLKKLTIGLNFQILSSVQSTIGLGI